MERSAAVFFEGRVLSSTDTEVKVEVAGAGKSMSVAIEDVYRLPSSKRPPSVGRFAICRAREREWTPCRIAAVRADAVEAEDADGARVDVPAVFVLSPTPVTSLNIGRYFERKGVRKAFREQLRRAGRPRRPSQWNPEPTDRVVARDANGWYSARAAGEADGGTRVVWESDRGSATVVVDRVVPPPPYSHPFATGDFALLEPSVPSQSWKPVRVEEVEKDVLAVRDEAGQKSRVSPRKLIPIR